MKMNKLFASVATAVVALAAVAPVASVHAEDALPHTANATKDSQDGSTSATSTASVHVIDGYLTLDKVPDLAFDPAVAGAKMANLKNGDSFVNQTGNDHAGAQDGHAGTLQISDSRSDARDGSGNATGNGLGYSVSVKLGTFEDKDGNVISPADGAQGFAINFGNVFSSEYTDGGVGHSIKPGVVVNAGTPDADYGNEATIINVKAGNPRGTETYDFGKQNGQDGIRLMLPLDVKEGYYTAPIQWTLNAEPQNS